MFKIKKDNLKFALTIASKILAQRKQDEIIYKSVRIVSGDSPVDGSFVAFASNGGYNAIRTGQFEITDFTEPLDILVECEKLMAVVDKATVDEITIEKIDEENILVTANGENRIRYQSGENIPVFAEYDENLKLGSIAIKDFSKACNLAVPFCTTDIHNEHIIGLCLAGNNLFATDEKKGITISGLSINVDKKLSFNPIAAEILKTFPEDSIIDFYLAKNPAFDEYSHLVFVVGGIEIFVLKYANEFPTEQMLEVNEICGKTNSNVFSIGKSSALQALSRISIFADENEILAVTPTDGAVILETLNAKTGEQSKETVQADVSITEDLIGQPVHLPFSNFRIVLEASAKEVVSFGYTEDTKVVSVFEDGISMWFSKKRIE